MFQFAGWRPSIGGPFSGKSTLTIGVQAPVKLSLNRVQAPALRDRLSARVQLIALAIKPRDPNFTQNAVFRELRFLNARKGLLASTDVSFLSCRQPRRLAQR